MLPPSRVFRTNCDCAAKFFSTVVHCWCDPCYEAVALVFTKIYINISQDSHSFREKTYAGIDELVVDRKVPDRQMAARPSEGRTAQQHYEEKYGGGYDEHQSGHYDNSV
jgi:hypothetical protein